MRTDPSERAYIAAATQLPDSNVHACHIRTDQHVIIIDLLIN